MTKLIGIAGRKGSGKDTAAEVLIWHGYTKVKFADALKNMLRAYLDYVGVDQMMRERMIEGDQKEHLKECLGMRSARFAMQTLGTEWGREIMDNNLWIDAFKRRVEQFDKVVCTDVRFKNEANVIKELGGKVIVINRPTQSATDSHPSELEIDTLPADIYLNNDGTIEDLRNQVKFYE